MARLTAMVASAAASAALATAAIGAGAPQASAATNQSAHHTGAHKVHRQIARKMPGARMDKTRADKTRMDKTRAAKARPADPVHVVGQYGKGQYVSVVNCQGQQAPPPVRLRQQGTPLRVTGGKPTAGVTRALAQRNRYKTVYTCTVEVKKALPRAAGKGGGLKPCELGKSASRKGASGKGACAKPVTLNTGFGGAAHSVSGHRPRR